MPGSPPTSSADPATIPPPIARSNSASPLGSRSGRAARRFEPDQRDQPPAALEIVLGGKDVRHLAGFLDERVPFGAIDALTLPAVRHRSAGLAHISGFGLGHGSHGLNIAAKSATGSGTGALSQTNRVPQARRLEQCLMPRPKTDACSITRTGARGDPGRPAARLAADRRHLGRGGDQAGRGRPPLHLSRPPRLRPLGPAMGRTRLRHLCR